MQLGSASETVATRAILDSIRRIVRSLRVSSRAAERDLGLSGAQLFVLQVLTESDRALSINELAERTCTHQSSVSAVVSRLEENRLVHRAVSREDGRRSEIEPTEAGRRLARRAPLAAQERLRDAIARLEGTDRIILAKLLGKLVTAADLSAEPPSLFFEEDPSANEPTRKKSK